MFQFIKLRFVNIINAKCDLSLLSSEFPVLKTREDIANHLNLKLNELPPAINGSFTSTLQTSTEDEIELSFHEILKAGELCPLWEQFIGDGIASSAYYQLEDYKDLLWMGITDISFLRKKSDLVQTKGFYYGRYFVYTVMDCDELLDDNDLPFLDVDGSASIDNEFKLSLIDCAHELHLNSIYCELEHLCETIRDAKNWLLPEYKGITGVSCSLDQDNCLRMKMPFVFYQTDDLSLHINFNHFVGMLNNEFDMFDRAIYQLSNLAFPTANISDGYVLSLIEPLLPEDLIPEFMLDGKGNLSPDELASFLATLHITVISDFEYMSCIDGSTLVKTFSCFNRGGNLVARFAIFTLNPFSGFSEHTQWMSEFSKAVSFESVHQNRFEFSWQRTDILTAKGTELRSLNFPTQHLRPLQYVLFNFKCEGFRPGTVISFQDIPDNTIFPLLLPDADASLTAHGVPHALTPPFILPVQKPIPYLDEHTNHLGALHLDNPQDLRKFSASIIYEFSTRPLERYRIATALLIEGTPADLVESLFMIKSSELDARGGQLLISDENLKLLENTFRLKNLSAIYIEWDLPEGMFSDFKKLDSKNIK